MTKGLYVPIIDGRKLCPKCGVNKSVDEYYLTAGGTVRSPCKACVKLGSKKRYDDTNPNQRAYVKILEQRAVLKRQLVAEAGGCCTHCGYSRSVHALDFHHTVGDKEDTIANLLMKAITMPYKWLPILKAEAAKCVLLCANCHRELHSE